MNASCSRATFKALPNATRAKLEALLINLHTLQLTCRVERLSNGTSAGEVVVTVGPAMPAAAYWLDRLDIDREAALSV